MKKQKQSKRKQKKVEKVKVTVRLLAAIDERIRVSMGRRGDMARIVTEALDRFEISDAGRQLPRVRAVGAVSVAPPTTVLLEKDVVLQLRAVARLCDAPVNSVVNGALAAWRPL